MTVTRILLPVLIAIVAILGLVTVVPIFFRELLRPWYHRRYLDEWSEDLDEWER